MTTLDDRPNSALVVVDMQNAVVEAAHHRQAVVANIVSLVARARAHGAPVIWVQHSDDHVLEGSAGWEFITELPRLTSDPVVAKHYGDSFEDSTLESHLAQLRVGRVVVAGAQTDACVRATLHGAFVRGYDTVLVSDAHTTEDLTSYGLPSPDKVIVHTNTYWTWQAGPGRTASVVSTADVAF
jgi:nicotinamidase-related amidase